MTTRPFISPEELADRTDTNIKTIYAALQRGEIPHKRIGRKYLIPRAWIEQVEQAVPNDVSIRCSTTTRRLIGTFHDGSQVLIEQWTDDNPAFVSGPNQRATAARRSHKWDTWSLPVELEVAP